MDPRLLYQLAEIVEHGSLSKAAERLNLTQPTLSRNVRIIEDRVGAPVLLRGPLGVIPTEIGARLAEEGRQIAWRSRNAAEILDQWREGLKSQVRLGVGPMLALSVMPGFLRAGIERPWSFALAVTTATPQRLLGRLIRDELDVALAPAKLNLHHENLHQETLFQDRLGVFVGARHPLARRGRDPVAPSALNDCRWIDVGAQSRIHGTHVEVLRDIGVAARPSAISFTGDVSMAVALLTTTDAVCLLARKLARLVPQGAGLREIPLTVALPRRDIAFWTPRKALETPSVIEFRRRVTAHMARFGDDGAGAEALSSSVGP